MGQRALLMWRLSSVTSTTPLVKSAPHPLISDRVAAQKMIRHFMVVIMMVVARSGPGMPEESEILFGYYKER